MIASRYQTCNQTKSQNGFLENAKTTYFLHDQVKQVVVIQAVNVIHVDNVAHNVDGVLPIDYNELLPSIDC